MGSKSTLKKDTNEKENSIYKKKKKNEKEKKMWGGWLFYMNRVFTLNLLMY